jgi:hypothetical protein
MATKLSASDVFLVNTLSGEPEPISEGMIGFAGVPDGKPSSFMRPLLYESDSPATEMMMISDSLGQSDAQRSRHSRVALNEVLR